MPSTNFLLAWLLTAGLAFAQTTPKKPASALRAESASTFALTSADEKTVEIRNVTYDVSSGPVPGRPEDERLLLRNTTVSKRVIGEMYFESKVMLEAWPLGQDLRQKPLYKLTVPGADGRIVENALFVVQHGQLDTEWWSIHKLASGQHLFDTYAPLLSFTTTGDLAARRYAGLEIPGDDSDARLKQSNVVAVLTYASEDRVIREALVTCDDPKRAAVLQSTVSLEESSRLLTLAEGPNLPGPTLRLYFSANYPSPNEPAEAELRIAVRNDDLDVAHAQLPVWMHVAAWKR